MTEPQQPEIMQDGDMAVLVLTVSESLESNVIKLTSFQCRGESMEHAMAGIDFLFEKYKKLKGRDKHERKINKV